MFTLSRAFMAPISTRVLNCDSSSIHFHGNSGLPHISHQETRDALKLAAHHLTNLSDTIAFPTETVYGLAAAALDSRAVGRIFEVKGRPADNPLIVHVSSVAMLHSTVQQGYTLSEAYRVLIKRFWPGALTLLFPRNSSIIPSIITAGQATVAVRMPSHPVARALIAIADTPLAAPSANTSGKPSPTRANHVLRDLHGKISILLDGGACDVGLESTVIDGLHEDGNLRILRPGGVTVEDIERALKEELRHRDNIPHVLVHHRDFSDEAMEQAPTTPGMKYTHYSPSVPLFLLMTLSPPPSGQRSITIPAFFDSLRSSHKLKIGLLSPSDSRLWRTLPTDSMDLYRYPLGPIAGPAVSAHRLFDGLITLEQEGVDVMLIEEIREDREGLAFMNRVRKAAHGVRWITIE